MLIRISLVFFFLLSIGLWVAMREKPELVAEIPARILPKPDPPLKPQPARYQVLIGELDAQRQSLAARYVGGSLEERSLIESEALELLEAQLPKLMRCWLGTPWDFNGTSDTPGKGKIACGYFVSTVLRDAGFKVERFRLAQQPSQNIIATFLNRDEMHIRTQTNYDQFLDEVISRGPGVQIIGLDSHVAFLVVNNDESVNFIHSSGMRPWAVVDESRSKATVLQASNYRVIGNLTRSQRVIQGWLEGEKWVTRRETLSRRNRSSRDDTSKAASLLGRLSRMALH